MKGAYIFGDIIVDLDVLHVIPIKVLGEEEGQNHSQDQRDAQTEAATGEGRSNLL